MQQHLIISGVPQFYIGGPKSEKLLEESSGDDEENHSDADVDSGISFHLTKSVRLSPPGLSALAKRRGTATHASANYITNNHRRPLVSHHSSVMGSVDSFVVSSGSWQ